MTDPALSLVIPVFNERESLAALHAEIAAVAGGTPWPSKSSSSTTAAGTARGT